MRPQFPSPRFLSSRFPWPRLPSTRRGPWALSLLVALAAAALSTAATVQPPPASDAPVTFDSLVKALHGAKYQEREDATLALMRLSADRRSDVEHALSRETDVEAITRLTRVAVHLMLKAKTSLRGPVSLLGITLTVETLKLDPKDDDVRGAVVVTGVQPGFPAAEVLQAGDRIIAVDDRPFDSGFTFEDFRGLIGRRKAGSILQMTVLRHGSPFKAGVQLAGLTEAEMVSVSEFVGRRLAESAAYAEHLKTGLPGAPLVIKDDSKPEPFEADIEIIGGQ